MALDKYRRPSLKDKIRERTNEELKADIEKMKEIPKVEEAKNKKEKKDGIKK